MSSKQGFRVEIRFKPILKASWFGSNGPGTSAFDQRQYIDVNDALVLDPKYENGKFVTAHLRQSNTGMLWMVLDTEEQYKMVERALKEAREKQVPTTFGYGENPKKKWVKNKSFRRLRKK
jgi:hypothetical protein